MVYLFIMLHNSMAMLLSVFVFFCFVLFFLALNGVLFMVLNTTFNNISVISWRSVLLMEETGVSIEVSKLLQVTDRLYHIILY